MLGNILDHCAQRTPKNTAGMGNLISLAETNCNQAVWKEKHDFFLQGREIISYEVNTECLSKL